MGNFIFLIVWLAVLGFLAWAALAGYYAFTDAVLAANVAEATRYGVTVVLVGLVAGVWIAVMLAVMSDR